MATREIVVEERHDGPVFSRVATFVTICNGCGVTGPNDGNGGHWWHVTKPDCLFREDDPGGDEDWMLDFCSVACLRAFAIRMTD